MVAVTVEAFQDEAEDSAAEASAAAAHPAAGEHGSQAHRPSPARYSGAGFASVSARGDGSHRENHPGAGNPACGRDPLRGGGRARLGAAPAGASAARARPRGVLATARMGYRA